MMACHFARWDIGRLQFNELFWLPLIVCKWTFWQVCLATINTILDSMPEQLDVAALIEPLKAGLADQQDVQVLCHQIVVKLLGNRFLLVKGSILR